MVVPSTFVTPHMFSWLGIAGTCVIGNAFTGVLTMCLLFIASYAVCCYKRLYVYVTPDQLISLWSVILFQNIAHQYGFVRWLRNFSLWWIPRYRLVSAYNRSDARYLGTSRQDRFCARPK